MPSNQTPNYKLNQWEADDQVRRADFNADNAKIDAAIKAVDRRADSLGSGKADKTALTALQTVVNGKGNCRIATGSYTGTGDTPATLKLSFTPKLLIVAGESYHAVFVYGLDQASVAGSTLVRPFRVTWLEDGLYWMHSSGSYSKNELLNAENTEYRYVALY